jgi:hypothetical protein
MRTLKARLTVTVEPGLVRAGREAVAAGDAESLSAWVNVALTDRAARDRRLRALGEAVSAYEAEFGVITAKELADQARADRLRARVVRGSSPRPPKPRRRRGTAA